MSVFDDIQDRINKRAAELILPRFLELEARKHAKHGFREGCPCTYCRAKRAATADIAYIGRRFLHHKTPESATYEQLDPWERSAYTRTTIREHLRLKHRRILKELFNGQAHPDQQ